MIIRNNTEETQILGFIDMGLELSPGEEYTIDSYKIRNNLSFKDMLESEEIVIVEYDEELISQPAERVTIQNSELGETLDEVILSLENTYYRSTGELNFSYLSLTAEDSDALLFDPSGSVSQQTISQAGLINKIVVDLSSTGSVDVNIFKNDEIISTISVVDTSHTVSEDLALVISSEDYITVKATPTDEEFTTQNILVRVSYVYGVEEP